MDGFITGLANRLAGDLPGEKAQLRMAPPYRPGMHDALSSVASPRQSAVLLYLFPEQAHWHLVLMKRPEYDGAHGGQVGIPGGCLEPGENHRQAAVREFIEETGVPVDSEQLLGCLTDLFIPSSNFLVRPFVACATERPVYSPDPVEVEEIIEFEIASLLHESTIRRGRVCLSNGASIEAPFYAVQGHVVWGATAMVLSEFKEILRGIG